MSTKEISNSYCFFSVSGMEQFYFSFCFGGFAEVMTSLPSTINTIMYVEEWDIKINAVKKEVWSFSFNYFRFY